MSFLQSSFNSEKKTEKPVLPSGYQDVGAGGGGGGWRFKGRLVGALLQKPFDLSNPV